MIPPSPHGYRLSNPSLGQNRSIPPQETDPSARLILRSLPGVDRVMATIRLTVDFLHDAVANPFTRMRLGCLTRLIKQVATRRGLYPSSYPAPFQMQVYGRQSYSSQQRPRSRPCRDYHTGDLSMQSFVLIESLLVRKGPRRVA